MVSENTFETKSIRPASLTKRWDWRTTVGSIKNFRHPRHNLYLDLNVPLTGKADCRARHRQCCVYLLHHLPCHLHGTLASQETLSHLAHPFSILAAPPTSHGTTAKDVIGEFVKCKTRMVELIDCAQMGDVWALHHPTMDP